MSKNLGFYQVAVVAIKKVGGPKNFIRLCAAVGVSLIGVGVAAGPKLIEFFHRLVKVFKGKTDEQILDQAEECQVVQEGAAEEGVYFHVGEQIKVIYKEKDMALIYRMNDKNSPYLVSTSFLTSITNLSSDN
ncbi:hypothetical protein [Lancefieldella parvula]|uniref:hypothetical protein n=1 Tax=Lancefieldella parvula TaxID=1382 RepID=UPI0028D1FD59|nr:hypothetical protein [Lancefieldella parvula]